MTNSLPGRPPSVEVDGAGKVRNISAGMMKPLYTSCWEHNHQEYRNRTEGSHFLPTHSSPTTSTSKMMQDKDDVSSTFMRLPTEIRLQIYSLILPPGNPADLLPSFERVSSSTQDYFDYDKKRFGTDIPVTADLSNPTLRIRTIDPIRYKGKFAYREHVRSGYSVRADRFRARCMETTYHCINTPFRQCNISILRVNKQIHEEAAEVLYSNFTFDFDTHVEAIIPFLSDLTPIARSCVKGLRIVKRALPYDKEFDRCEWQNAMRFLTCPSNDINLRRLELGVVAGRHGDQGWDHVSRLSAEEVNGLLTYSDDGMEWLQCLLELKGIRELDVEAVVEHCPPATTSSAMARFVRFSASIDSGFQEFLQARMLQSVSA